LVKVNFDFKTTARQPSFAQHVNVFEPKKKNTGNCFPLFLFLLLRHSIRCNLLRFAQDDNGVKKIFAIDDFSNCVLFCKMSEEWRNEPASERQMQKLQFFGCTWDDGITKGQASDAIDECAKRFPEVEAAYQNRPATEQQRSVLRGFGKRPRATLTYGKAKELIKGCENFDWLKEVEKIDKEYVIDVSMWEELYPGLTYSRVQKAAKLLDEMQPGWRQENNHLDIMLSKVAELNPKLLERWSPGSLASNPARFLRRDFGVIRSRFVL
jgi:hypothetical protein